MDVQKLYKAGCAHKEASAGGAVIGGALGTVGGAVSGGISGGGLGLTLAALFAKKEKMLGAMKKGAIIGSSVGAGFGAVGGGIKGAIAGSGALSPKTLGVKTVAAKQKSNQS